MRVIRLSLYQIDIPMSHEIATADGGSTALADVSVVKLTSSDGLEGWGAVTPLWEGAEPGLAGAVRDQIRAAAVVGVEIDADTAVHRLFDERARSLTPGWSAIDCALWDLSGKGADRPTAGLLSDAPAAIVDVSDAVPATSLAQCGGITGVLRLSEDQRRHVGETAGTEIELAAVAHLASATGASMRNHTMHNKLSLGGDGVIVHGSVASTHTGPGTLTEPNIGILGHPIDVID